VQACGDAQPHGAAQVHRAAAVPRWRRWYLLAAAVLVLGAAALTVATRLSIRDLPSDLDALVGTSVKSQVLARDGTPLSYTLANSWNATDVVPLSSIPPLLQRAMLVSEDQHFYEHHGVDWSARFAAVLLDVRTARPARGASSITEQVVKMVHPRPRNLWSRWVEGFEAGRLDSQLSKAQILNFYLNQVPYAGRRRGVVQAARLYFDRGLDTLSTGEQLALAVLVRSPVGMDLRRNPSRARWAVEQLADRMLQRGDLTVAQREQVRTDPWVLSEPREPVEASHFVSHVLNLPRNGPVRSQVQTTLDPHVQATAQKILDGALAGLARRHVHNGALIVIDHQRNEVLAWVVGRGKSTRRVGVGAGTRIGHGAGVGSDAGPGTEGLSTDGSPGIGYDTVLTPRQPGSTMKPLLYALALEHGWTAATLIDDSELSEPVGGGQHTFHNYSHRHYGLVRLRDALGNSLNIPAVKTLRFVGADTFMERLHSLGINSLTQNPNFYGDGLALGNGGDRKSVV